MKRARMSYKDRKKQMIEVAARQTYAAIFERKDVNFGTIALATDVAIGTVNRLIPNYLELEEMLIEWAQENTESDNEDFAKYANAILEYEIPFSINKRKGRNTETKNKLLHAAIKIASAKGHNSKAFSASAIGGSVGMSPGAVSGCYDCMDDLKKDVISWCQSNPKDEKSKRILTVYDVVGL